jgi:hypothetical protein
MIHATNMLSTVFTTLHPFATILSIKYKLLLCFYTSCISNYSISSYCQVKKRTKTNTYLNNRLEQDHRGIKQRYYPMRGFGTFEAATRFCCAFDELRNDLRPRCIMGEAISFSERRRAFLDQMVALQALLQVAS